jgi:DNA-binding transcriptional LysR family regulator
MLLERIELFVKVAKYCNLAKAAREIHVSPSSICQRLKSLENEFGVKLYNRNKEGIVLSKAGQILFSAATEIIRQLDVVRRTLHSVSQPTLQSLTVGGNHTPSVNYLPSAIAVFKKTHPKVNVRFLTADQAGIEKLVRESAVDIAVIQHASKASDFYKEHFAVDKLTFFAHPAHPLAKKKRLSLEDISRTALIIRRNSHSTEKVLNELRRRGLSVNIALHCLLPEAVKAAVRRKMGIGILYYNLIEQDIKRKELKPIKICGLTNITVNSYIVYSNKRPLSDAATDFLSLLRSMKKPVKIAPDDGQKEIDNYDLLARSSRKYLKISNFAARPILERQN